MTPWSHAISLMPLYDKFFYQEVAKARECFENVWKCASCKKEPTFYATWFYFTSPRPESDKRSVAERKLCPTHAAKLASKYGVEIQSHVAQSSVFGWLPKSEMDLMERRLLDRYEAETGLKLPVPEGWKERLHPSYINALVAISSDPERTICKGHPGLVVHAERNYSAESKSPTHVFHFKTVSRMIEVGWLAPRVREGALFPLMGRHAYEWTITPAGEQVLKLIRSTVGGFVP